MSPPHDHVRMVQRHFGKAQEQQAEHAAGAIVHAGDGAGHTRTPGMLEGCRPSWLQEEPAEPGSSAQAWHAWLPAAP